LIKISIYGFKDGDFNVKTLKLGQNRYKEDVYVAPYASTEVLKASASGEATASITLGTTVDYPRTIRVVNEMAAAAERAIKVLVKGYTGQGNYEEEAITLGTAADSNTSGNIAFAYVSSIVPAVSTKGYGTYGTVSIYPGDKFGITEYVDAQTDVLMVQALNGDDQTRAISTAINATTFSKPYQTLDIGGISYTGSTIVLKYRSKFQTKNTR